jgi:type II secretion system protein H
MKYKQGFTLLELLIVLAIMGIMIGAIGLSVSSVSMRLPPQAELSVLRLQLLRAEEYALASHQPIGIVFSEKGYTFYVPSTQDPSKWQPAAFLKAGKWVSFKRINFSLDPNAMPQIIIDGAGGITPFTLQDGDNTLTGEASGALTIQ